MFTKYFKPISLLIIIALLLQSVAYGHELENASPQNVVFSISDNTTVSISEEYIQQLQATGVSLEEIEECVQEQTFEYLLSNGLSTDSKDMDPIVLRSINTSSLPPGSRTYGSKSGSNVGSVWAGIPAIGHAYIEISYTYSYVKWVHDLYQLHGCLVDSDKSKVTGSVLTGVSLGTWEHESGSVRYVDHVSYGENLEVVANGFLTFPIGFTIRGISFPANSTSRQSFAYFHPV